jgi:hypothetical protein
LIDISVYSNQEYHYSVRSNGIGEYLFNLDTSLLEFGLHQTKSKSTLGKEKSLYNSPVSFIIGGENKSKDNMSCSSIRGDLNCDTRVNLIDFSIMAYWYRKIIPPTIIDFNSDGKISIVDFSIMAFNWTG